MEVTAKAEALEQHSAPAGGGATIPSDGFGTPVANTSTGIAPTTGGSISAPAS
jgi:hypothetical protein